MAIDKNKIIEAATKYVQKGQYDKAIKEYQKLLEADPKDARIQQKLGELYQKKGDNLLAADCFLKVAESYAADGFFLKSVAVYKQVLKLNPTLVEVNLKLAELHQQLGLMSDAMAQFQLVANHYEKNGNIRASLDTLRKMVDLDPDNVASRIKLAELYARETMNPEAIAEFGRAAEYLKRNNRVDDYIKVAERLVFLDPNNLDLTRELANIYLTKQDTKRALAKLQLCFKADPKDVETLNMLAQAFKDLGQLSKTVSVYKELAKIYDEQDRVDEEREVWRKVLELAPDDPDARSRQSHAPQPSAPVPTAPRPVAAAAPAAAAAALGSRPSVEQIPRLLTETDVYVKYGLHEKALEHLKKVFAIDPDSVDGHEKAAELFATTGNNQGALDSLVKVVQVCIARGELDRARASLRRLCDRDPAHPQVPGFLNAVGGLSQEEEVAEIEEDAILVEASDEAIEVAPEPESEPLAEELVPQEVVSLESDQGESIEPLAADDEALEAAAQEAVSDGQEIYAELAGDEELIAASPEGDELALSTAESSLQVSEPLEETPFGPDPGAEVGEELEGEATMAVVDPEDFSAIEPEMENLGEPLEGPGTEDGEVELQPTLPGKVSIEAARPPPGSDVYEEATRVAHLPSLLIQAATPKTDPGSISQATTLQGAQQPIDEFEDEPTTILPRLDSTAPSELPPSPKTLPGARDARELLAQVQAVAPEPQAPVAEQSQVSEAEAQEEPALDELEEAAFFIDQQMYDEAREIIETVILSYPTSLRAKELLARLELVEAGGAAAPVATPEQSGVSQLQAATTDGAFDLASELAKEDIGGPGEVSAAQPGEDFQYSVEDVFDEFKKGLRKVVKPEDVDTHYDLGIAYKEMGLLEDAIGEFEQAAAAAAGKKKEIESLAMVGLCRIERSEWNEAVEAFQRALALPQVTPETAKAVRFELAQALEKMGRGGEALHHYEKVQKADPDFRDVGSAVERLIESGAEEEHTEPTGRSLKGPSNGSSARADAKPDVATGPEEPSPKGPNDPKGKKARKIGYV